jgi:exonuclease VII small subunit
MQTQDLQQRYEEARHKLQELQARVQRAAGRLEAAKKQYADLAALAKAQYGVSNLAELEALVQRYEQENTAALQAFEASLQQVRQEVERVEAALQEAGV